LSEHPGVSDFRHEAILYRGESQFLERVVPFVRDGLAAGEPTLVMVNRQKIHALREIIGADGDGLVEYRDMEFVGANPARIIPAWNAFSVAGAHQGAARMRGVGEPIWPGRAAAQLEECHWHEALINRAFARLQGFWLICPYDTAALDPSVLIEARYTHPLVTDGMAIDSYPAEAARQEFVVPTAPLASPLPPPDGVVAEVAFDAGTLGKVRAMVAAKGAQAGLLPSRLDDLILAVSEVATNSVIHGGGHGLARLWVDGGDVVCEVSDRGVISDPLVDRQCPGTNPSEPRGLWTANQLCDLVQVRSSRETGSVVRLLVHAGRRAA
jgi:anti-sigma regulatory factor (Ser/Thr protein kinase)